VKNVGRKAYHAAGGLFLLSIYHFLTPRQAFAVYASLLAALLLFDVARLRLPAFNAWALERMGTLLRPGEAGTLTGSPAYVVGAALTLFLFDLPVATAAVLFLAFGDVAATLVGESWGRTKFRGKSVEGTAAFVVAGLVAGAATHLFGLGVDLPILAAGVLTAAAVEVMMPLGLNDNLSIPLSAAAVMTLLGRLLGQG
jgi:dolichol kinase